MICDCNLMSPLMPCLSYLPTPTVSSLGDRTVQMSSFMDISDMRYHFIMSVITWGSHCSDVKFHRHFRYALPLVTSDSSSLG
ncbi:hypothetical protein M405DRAFT_232260 [Rhizopogon salebrosus TDB-379]|nr:hypothetical protein M405DRAFT_232260 [Rhizopogon salebrosus TDB-379]